MELYPPPLPRPARRALWRLPSCPFVHSARLVTACTCDGRLGRAFHAAGRRPPPSPLPLPMSSPFLPASFTPSHLPPPVLRLQLVTHLAGARARARAVRSQGPLRLAPRTWEGEKRVRRGTPSPRWHLKVVWKRMTKTRGFLGPAKGASAVAGSHATAWPPTGPTSTDLGRNTPVASAAPRAARFCSSLTWRCLGGASPPRDRRASFPLRQPHSPKGMRPVIRR